MKRQQAQRQQQSLMNRMKRRKTDITSNRETGGDRGETGRETEGNGRETGASQVLRHSRLDPDMMEIQPEHFTDSVGDSAEQNTMSTSEWDCSFQFVTEMMQAFFRWQAEERAKINLAGGTPSVAGSYRETLRDDVKRFFDPERCCTEQQGETFVLSKEQAIVFLEIFERAYHDTEALMQSLQRWEAEEAECSAVCPTQQKVEAELRDFFDLRRESAEYRGETHVTPAPVSTQTSDRKDEKSAGRRGRHMKKRSSKPRDKIGSSRTKAAETADLISDPLEFVEDLEQDCIYLHVTGGGVSHCLSRLQ